MTQQDIIIGKEVIYHASHAIIVGHIRGLAQLSNGCRVAVLETKEHSIFLGDIHHMQGVDQLQAL